MASTFLPVGWLSAKNAVEAEEIKTVVNLNLYTNARVNSHLDLYTDARVNGNLDSRVNSYLNYILGVSPTHIPVKAMISLTTFLQRAQCSQTWRMTQAITHKLQTCINCLRLILILAINILAIVAFQ